MKEDSLGFNKKEAISSNASLGLSENFFVPFMIFLKSSPLHLSYFNSLQNFFGPLSQTLTYKFYKFFSRKKLIIISFIFQIFIWFFIILCSYFFLKKFFLIYLLIFVYAIYVFFTNLASPAFISWMGEMVNEKERGKFFGKRNSLGTLSFIIASILGALFLDFLKPRGLIFEGFLLLFLASIFFKFFSIYFFAKQYEPKFSFKKEEYFSFFQFLKEAPKRNYGKFSLFLSAFTLSTNISAPYYSLYILRDLKLTYFQFMLANTLSALSRFLFFPIWGRLIDIFGNLSILRFTGNFIPLIAFFYPFSLFLPPSISFYFIIFIFIFGGIFWSGFNLASLNFLYDSVSPGKRSICSAYTNLLNGIGVIFGSLTGGVIINNLSNLSFNLIMVASLISGILRLLTIKFLFNFLGIREKRVFARKLEFLIFYLHNEISEIPAKVWLVTKRAVMKFDFLKLLKK